MKKTVITYCWLALLLAFCTGVAKAQFSSSIEGTVTDSTGAIVPGAHVVVTGMTTGVAVLQKQTEPVITNFQPLGLGTIR
jgi:hypothetical protein